ncbi:hypothetical protein D3C76_420890 [compost metagenome]|jgi:hypothetical protein|nr:hypothetical protein PspS34_16310 [Pseudomonas sp. S34]VVO45822.1 hypothetical protein PS843_00010 [Pseudomonas fluorescens]VVP38907.1 hypothetical protein PS893_04743 [Pseudomonas fluorescens]
MLWYGLTYVYSVDQTPLTRLQRWLWEVSDMWNHALVLVMVYLTITLTIGWLYTMALLYWL